ncbi:hypothetical protein B0H14DRAFT_3600959 [Mycena olivaceomarginata]|nr:hypothetical protein B0H14DRAFT_3600959 [Mycena olivaceomarginata]
MPWSGTPASRWRPGIQSTKLVDTAREISLDYKDSYAATPTPKTVSPRRVLPCSRVPRYTHLPELPCQTRRKKTKPFRLSPPAKPTPRTREATREAATTTATKSRRKTQFPEPPPRTRTSDYLVRRCPACFGGLKHDPSQAVDIQHLRRLLVSPRSANAALGRGILLACTRAPFFFRRRTANQMGAHVENIRPPKPRPEKNKREKRRRRTERGGEKQFYMLALLEMMFQHLPTDIHVGLLYDVACMLHLSCAKYGFLDRYMDRILFAVSVFHAFGHWWACQIVYHPLKCIGFGLTTGRDASASGTLLANLISYLRVSGIEQDDRASLCRLAAWLNRRTINCEEKLRSALADLEACEVPETVLRAEWKNQVDVQTRPLKRQAKTHGAAAVDRILQARKTAEVAFMRVKSMEEIMADTSSETHERVHELHGSKRGGKPKHLEQELGIQDATVVKKLAHGNYYTARNERQGRERAFGIKAAGPASSSLIPLSALFGGLAVVRFLFLASTSKPAQRACRSGNQEAEPNISKLLKMYNKLCKDIASLIRTKKAPKGAVALPPIPEKGLYQLDVDDAIWQDVGLNDVNGDPPRWLTDDKFKLRRQELLELMCSGRSRWIASPSDDMGLPEWGPSNEEVLECQISNSTPSWVEGTDGEASDEKKARRKMAMMTSSRLWKRGGLQASLPQCATMETSTIVGALGAGLSKTSNEPTGSAARALQIKATPDVPTGDLSPLPYPAPKNQHERMANIQSVLCRAAQAEPAFRELWNERTAFEFNCVAAENVADYQDRLTETAHMSMLALYALKANLGPRALAYVDRELTPGGTLRWACRQSGFGYWLSATDNDTEACEALAAAAATARDVAADAVAEAAMHNCISSWPPTTGHHCADCMPSGRGCIHTVALDRASTAQDATPKCNSSFVIHDVHTENEHRPLVSANCGFFSELALNGCLMGANQLG